jgi:selenocysteine lyase/cysteine desulfurase
MSVCVQPMFAYAHAATLVRFVELHLQAGVAHVHVYVHSVTDEVLRVLQVHEAVIVAHCLQAYERLHIVSIHYWSPFTDDDINRRVYIMSTALAINDCLLRNRRRYSHVGMSVWVWLSMQHSSDSIHRSRRMAVHPVA